MQGPCAIVSKEGEGTRGCPWRRDEGMLAPVLSWIGRVRYMRIRRKGCSRFVNGSAERPSEPSEKEAAAKRDFVQNGIPRTIGLGRPGQFDFFRFGMPKATSSNKCRARTRNSRSTYNNTLTTWLRVRILHFPLGRIRASADSARRSNRRIFL